MATKKNTSLYLVALAFFVLGLGYLVFTAFSESAVYFKDVSKALEMPRENLKAARLFGTVKDQGIEKLGGEPGVRFQLEDQHDKSVSMWVLYKGAVPDAFKAGAEVIVEGGFTPDAPDFQAKTLMTKCPAKYEKQNRG